jgi:hypothetical protein
LYYAAGVAIAFVLLAVICEVTRRHPRIKRIGFNVRRLR